MVNVAHLYEGIINQVQPELVKFQDAINFLNLFTPKEVDQATLQTLIWNYLKPIGQASLSSALWDPAKVRIDVDQLSFKRFSSDISSVLPFEDWNIISQMTGGVADSNLGLIAEKPLIQATHYFFTGYKLMDDLTRQNGPLITQYNYMNEAGSGNGTLTRPNRLGSATAGAWSTYANMATDINLGISTLVANGFATNKNDVLVFYPRVAEPAMTKKRASGGDGMRNALLEIQDNGVPVQNIIPIDDIYGYTIAGAAPTNALFDLKFVDRSQIRVYYTVKPFVNTYVDQSGTKFPKLTIESGISFCPIFLPRYNASTGKTNKGVAAITAIVGT